jgi:hypothetical protein
MTKKRKLTEQHRKNLSAGQTGKKKSNAGQPRPWSKGKPRPSIKGKPLTEEHKKNMSNARLAKIASGEILCGPLSDLQKANIGKGVRAAALKRKLTNDNLKGAGTIKSEAR